MKGVQTDKFELQIIKEVKENFKAFDIQVMVILLNYAQ